MNVSAPHSATLALIRKRDGEVLLLKANRKSPLDGRLVGYWDLPRIQNKNNERPEQAVIRLVSNLGFRTIDSMQELASSEMEKMEGRVLQRQSVTLMLCNIWRELPEPKLPHSWSSPFIAAKLLEEAGIPTVFLGKLLEFGMYAAHKKPTFDFTEAPKATKKPNEIAPKIEM